MQYGDNTTLRHYQYSETVQVLPVERLQPQPIIICGVAAVEHGSKVGHRYQDQDNQRRQHQPAGQNQGRVKNTWIQQHHRLHPRVRSFPDHTYCVRCCHYVVTTEVALTHKPQDVFPVVHFYADNKPNKHTKTATSNWSSGRTNSQR